MRRVRRFSLHPDVAAFDPVEAARSAADSYVQSRGMAPIDLQAVRSATMPGHMAQRIANAYHAMPAHQESASRPYRALTEEVSRQADHLMKPVSKGGAGISFHVQEEDPYANSGEMLRDLRENNRLKVYATEPGTMHPFMTEDQNNLFRGVHDVLGHAAAGTGFHRHGEEGSFRHHAAMFTPLARQALATETRGQNTWLVTHGGGEQFPEQKSAILPASWMHQPGFPAHMVLGRRGARRAAVHQARQFNLQEG